MDTQIVIFEVGAEYFGVSIAAVESIIKMQPITRMPHTPNFVEGVTNLRGKILPVIDLRKRFGLVSRPCDGNSRIVVIAENGAEVGMVVDGVSEVLTLSEDAVEPTPPMATSADARFITGIARIDHRLVILLEMGKILSPNERQDLAVLSTPV
jgi:purine-binding chemotaxis protein CheW